MCGMITVCLVEGSFHSIVISLLRVYVCVCPLRWKKLLRTKHKSMCQCVCVSVCDRMVIVYNDLFFLALSIHCIPPVSDDGRGNWDRNPDTQ